MAAARVPEGSPAFRALEEHSLGMRLALAAARALTDGDGDGYSARFGGGDCDDRRGDSYPGAEDVPGDGVDQNCEGGDATALAVAQRPRAPPAARAGAGPPPAPGEAFAGNILIVSIDALRADRLGVAGYRRRGRASR